MSKEELERCHNMFKDSWKFLEKYSDGKDTDEYWNAAVNETREIFKKHEECGLIVNLVSAALMELERQAKEVKKLSI